MRILGISAYYHDAAAAMVVDGRVVAAAEEERFTRKKHDPGFPINAIRACLDLAGERASELDDVAFYGKPFLSSSGCWRPTSPSRCAASRPFVRPCPCG